MTSPPIPVLEISVSMSNERRDALLSALRRGAAAEAVELLDRWQPIETIWDDDEGLMSVLDRRCLELSAWLRDECRVHAEGGRFQHALALVDRYLLPPQLFNAAEYKARYRRLQP